MKILTIILLISLPTAVALAVPDIYLQKSVNNAFPMENEPVEFTVRVSNIGNEIATDVVVVDQLPPELIIPVGLAVFPSIGSYDPVTGEWTVGILDAGVSADLVVPAIVTELQPPACIVNSARSLYPGDFDHTNNEARAAIHQDGVERCADLSAEFSIGITEFLFFPECGVEDRYQGSIEIRNAGPDNARNVVVSLRQTPIVGAEISFDDPACQHSGTSICTVVDIAAGTTRVLNVTSALFQNRRGVLQRIDVEVDTTDTDYAPMNNFSSAYDVVSGFSSCEEYVPNIQFADTFSPADDVATYLGCFIATAAYGSPLDPHLDSLREFRDRNMMNNRPGRALVRFYYRHSPPLAEFIAERDWLRAVVRGLLTPIVYTIEHPRRGAILFFGLIALSLLGIRRLHRSNSMPRGRSV